MLLGKGTSDRNDVGMCSSLARCSCVELPGAPFPVQGECCRTSKCQTGEAIHCAPSTTTSTTGSNTKTEGSKATQRVPKKSLHQHGTGT